MQRHPINSSSLQQQFPEIYRDFFSRCQKVASASHSFLWAGEFAGLYHGITLAQKLPLRTFVGFEEDTHNTGVAPDYITYEPTEHRYSTRTLDPALHSNLLAYVGKNDTAITSGKVLHILSEVPLGHSLGSHGAIAAALALLLEPSDVSEEAIFSRAKHILSASQSGFSSGVSAFTALTEHTGPIAFQTKGSSFHAQPLAALVPHALSWPIDFGLIYSGAQSNVDSLVLANNQTLLELDQATNAIEAMMSSFDIPHFNNTYIDMLNMTTGLLINQFVDLFTKGGNVNRIERLFNIINQYQNLLHMVEISTSTTDLLYAEIHRMANKQINDVGSGAKISGLGRGGTMLFALPYGTHRTDILTMIEKVRKQTGKNIWLDYASWLDGIGGEKGRIDQDMQLKHHSPFIERDMLVLTLVKYGHKSETLFAQEKRASLETDFDLVLDKTANKITIGGEAITSKDLPSQKSAILIFEDLIRAPHYNLGNAQIAGTYGSNRYDLQGKIISPLIKQVKEKTGRDLQIKLKGDMYEHYELTLDPTNITVAIIEKKI